MIHFTSLRLLLPKLSLLVGMLFILPMGFSQNWIETKKINSSDRGQADGFGSQISMSGNFAIVGASGEDHDLNGFAAMANSGAAYIFEKNSSGQWLEAQKIIASDRAVDDHFGCAVAISGNFAISGAWFEEDYSAVQSSIYNSGAAYVFERNSSGQWVEAGKIVASDGGYNDRFGSQVAISGNNAIVGAYYDYEDQNGNNPYDYAGSAYLFERNSSGQWIEVQKLVASDRSAFDYFGSSVGIWGDFAFIGAPYEDQNANGSATLNSAGSVYVFKRDSLGVWSQIQKIVHSDRAALDQFGKELAVSGSTLVVAAPLENEDATGGNSTIESGSAYVFEQNSSGAWVETQKIVASDRYANDYFGLSLAIDGNKILAGSPSEDDDEQGLNRKFSAGSAYLFERNSTGQWIQVKKLVASDRDIQDGLGNAVGISGDDLFVGAPNEDHDSLGLNTMSSAGSVYLFQKNNSVGLPANSSPEDVKLYPNPSQGDFTLELGKKQANVNINVYDIKGQLVHTSQYVNRQSLNLYLPLPSGLYLLQVETEEESFTRKLVVE